MNSLLHITHANAVSAERLAARRTSRRSLEGAQLMRTSSSFAPTGSRSGSRLSETHFYATPVVREQPRPTLSGLDSSAW